ncbi:MAG: cell division protein ZapA [Flavobacteriales bacterium]|jgi:cell division protein ZapA|nr:cell division protein ZapA [Flavobacteriales bacterium]|tara:strand:+ start:5710 stop:5994 length:285 start_codon:yes stop_codon:yes gene_type:complete
MEKLNIKISLANRLYPMSVDNSDERMIRLSASKIEKILKNLKERYSVKDDQDLLAMCALQLCVKLEKIAHKKSTENEILIKEIVDIKNTISKVI